MHLIRNVGMVATLGAAMAACGGNAPTQAPGATQGGGGGGGATQAPAATENGGGGGGGGSADFTYGKVTFNITGPITKSGEFGFVPAASLFGGEQGSSLAFTDSADNSSSVISILTSQDGSVVVSYAGADGQVPAAECATSDWNIGAGTGKGKFDCKAAFTITAAGASVAGGEIKGEFSAHS